MKATQRAIAKLDKSIRNIDLKAKILIEGIYLSLNANHNTKRYRQNRNLLQMRTEPFEILFVKHGKKFGASVLGVQMMSQSSFELLFQFALQMQKELSIFTEHPALKDGKKYYEDIVHNRVHESNRKTRGGLGSGLGGINESTIRRSGGNSFFSTNPRFSAIGSMKGRPGDSTFAFGSSKPLVSKPRNTSNLDFDAIQRVRRTGQETKGRGFERNKPVIEYQVEEEEFDEEFSLNDTDEEARIGRAKVRLSGEKPSNKARTMVERPEEFRPTQDRFDRDQQREVERRTYQELGGGIPEPRQAPSAAPRTGPSRRNRGPGTEVSGHRNYRGQYDDFEEEYVEDDYMPPNRRKTYQEPFEYDNPRYY